MQYLADKDVKNAQVEKNNTKAIQDDEKDYSI